MTDGHPLGLALAVEAADQRRNLPQSEWAELSHMISARLLLELTTPRYTGQQNALATFRFLQ